MELGSYRKAVAREVFCGSADLLREGRLMLKGCDRPVELGSYEKLGRGMWFVGAQIFCARGG